MAISTIVRAAMHLCRLFDWSAPMQKAAYNRFSAEGRKRDKLMAEIMDGLPKESIEILKAGGPAAKKETDRIAKLVYDEECRRKAQ